jgi:hypothetical protein
MRPEAVLVKLIVQKFETATGHLTGKLIARTAIAWLELKLYDSVVCFERHRHTKHTTLSYLFVKEFSERTIYWLLLRRVVDEEKKIMVNDPIWADSPLSGIGSDLFFKQFWIAHPLPGCGSSERAG